MGEKPILFAGAMVRAILKGRKTVTRRLVTYPFGKLLPTGVDRALNVLMGKHWSHPRGWIRPYAAPGDRLWVRETWGDGSKFYPHSPTLYRADYAEALAGRPVDDCRSSAETARVLNRPHQPPEGCVCAFRWRPSIHMPRWASRLSLEVVSVRVERLQDVTEEDAKAEGVIPDDAPPGFMCGPGIDPSTHRGRFALLWNEINGERAAWETNPWVWRVEFKRLPL